MAGKLQLASGRELATCNLPRLPMHGDWTLWVACIEIIPELGKDASKSSHLGACNVASKGLVAQVCCDLLTRC